MVAVRRCHLSFRQLLSLCHQGRRTHRGAVNATGKGAPRGHRKTDDTEQGCQQEQVRGVMAGSGACWGIEGGAEV